MGTISRLWKENGREDGWKGKGGRDERELEVCKGGRLGEARC
jgi:hypothetical protein